MTTNNSAFSDLLEMLAVIHRELAINADQNGRTADSHRLTCRLIAQQPIRTSIDIHFVLRAAEIASEVDLEFLSDEMGSAADLLKRATHAIESLQHERHREAGQLLTDFLKPRR